MVKGMKLMGAALAVGALATVAWATIVTPPTLEVTAPTSVRVGTKFSIQAHATSGTNEFGESNGPIFLVLTVTHVARAGNGNGRKTTTLADFDNSHGADVDAPLQAAGWASGCEWTAESTVFTPEGPVTTVASGFTAYTNGNGAQP